MEIPEKFGMKEFNSVKNPMILGNKLIKRYGYAVDSTKLKQIVRSLRYLITTRPDLIYLVNVVSMYMRTQARCICRL